MNNTTNKCEILSIENKKNLAFLVAILKQPHGEYTYTLFLHEITQYTKTLPTEEQIAIYLKYGDPEKIDNSHVGFKKMRDLWGWAYENILPGGEHNEPFISWYLKNIYPSKVWH